MAPKVSSDECNIQISGDGPEKSKGGTGEINLVDDCTREEKFILTPDGKCVRFCKCFVGEEEELLQLAATCRCISGTRCGRVTTCSHYLLLVMITQQKPACNLHMPAFVSMGLTITAVE